MSEVEGSGIPQELKNLAPTSSRMVMETMLMKSLTMTTKLVLATLTNPYLELSFSGVKKGGEEGSGGWRHQGVAPVLPPLTLAHTAPPHPH